MAASITALILVACSAACGNAAPTEGAKLVTASEVVAAFRAAGADVAIEEGVGFLGSPAPEIVGATTDDLKTKYGEFTVLIWPVPITPSKWPGHIEGPDQDAVYWQQVLHERPPGPPTWVALKIYDNVEFRWFSPKHLVDERWRGLDQMLEALAANH